MRSLAVSMWLGLSSVGLAQSRAGEPMPLGLDRFMPPPTHGHEDHRLIELGRRLFFDPVLSIDSSLACASCHQPSKSFADGRSVSVGVFGRRGTRSVPSIINRGWGRAFFWDGRVSALEEQVLRPISEPTEMGHSADGAVTRLAQLPMWQTRFRLAFGEAVSRGGLARALAAYVRSIRAGESRFDRAMLGDARALTELEQRGLELFQGRARCVRCHSGALLTDEAFHNTGVAWRDGTPADSGRALVTRRSIDVGSFKTPTLRQIGLTAPYMHDGSLRTLEEVVDFYDRGGHPNTNRDAELHPLRLSPAEKAALLAFLAALDGRIVEGSTRTRTRSSR